MATQVHKAQRELRRSMRSGGNWRFKGLMLAALDTADVGAEDVARAWPTSPGEKRKHLAEASRRQRRALMRAQEDGEFDDSVRLTMSAPSETYTPYIGPGDAKERHLAESHFDEEELETGVDKDRYLKRMLLNESVTELDVVFREELLDTVIQGAQPFQIARDAANVTNVNTRLGDIPRGSRQLYAPKVAEGAEIPRDEENFDTVQFECDKHGLGFEVSDTLIDQAIVDLIERQVAFTGAAVENALNRKFLNNLIDNAPTDNRVDTGGSAATVSDVNQAAEQVELDDFGPVDSLVYHPEFKTDLFDDTNLVYANRAGSDQVLQDRDYNQLLGMELYTMSDGTYDGSNSWGFDTSSDTNETGAVVYNSRYVNNVIYRDIETKDYEDPIRDIQGGNARAYFDAIYHQPDAAATIRV